MAAIAFLVDGAASAHAAREAASARRTEGYTATPAGELEPGVVEDVPVEGDPRALATVGAGPLFMAGLAAGLGVGTKITLLATIGRLTIGVAILGGRRHWLRALGVWLGGLVITCGFWYGRNFVYALNPFPQIHKIGPIHLPGPDQLALYPRPPHSLSEYYNDPTVWQHKLFPVLHDRLGPLWPVILAVVVVALVWAFFRGGSALMRILAVTGMVAGIAYIFTPLTASGSLGDPSGFDANLRYVAPVLIVGFLLLPLIPWIRHGNRPWILIGLFTILLIQGTVTQANWKFSHHLRLDRVGLPDRRRSRTDRGRPAGAHQQGRDRRLRAGHADHGRGARAGARELLPRPPLRDRGAPPLGGGFRATPQWQPLQDWGRKASHQRIGVVGRASAFGQYFFYGTDLSQPRPVRRPAAQPRHLPADRQLRRLAPGDQQGRLRLHRHHAQARSRRDRGASREPLDPRDKSVRMIIQSGPAAVYKITGPLDPASLLAARGRGAHMNFGDYLQGSIELIAVAAAMGFAAVGMRGRFLPGWSGASARLAEVVLGLSLLVVTLELVGVVGLYRPGWVLLASLVVGLGIGFALRPARPGPPLWAPQVTPIALGVAVAAAFLVAVHWAMPTQTGLDIGMYLPNTTWHNAPFAARFVQDHQVGAVHYIDTLNLTVWFYPQNSELLHSAGVLFLGNDFLSPLINIGWMSLCLLAAWSFARPTAAAPSRSSRSPWCSTRTCCCSTSPETPRTTSRDCSSCSPRQRSWSTPTRNGTRPTRPDPRPAERRRCRTAP